MNAIYEKRCGEGRVEGKSKQKNGSEPRVL